MAKEPHDRDEAKRSDAPVDPASGAPPRRDAGRAPNDDRKQLPDDSFLLDVGGEAPRVHSAAADDASEEWILVEDDLVASASESDAAVGSKAGARSPAADPTRNEENAQIVDEMKEIGSSFTPAAPYDADGGGADQAGSENGPDAGVVDPLEPEGAPHDDGFAPSSATPPSEPLLAPVLQMTSAPAAEKKPARSTRRPMARVAGIAIAASLVAGGWFAVQYVRTNGLPKFDVASTPTTEKPLPPPTPVAKPQPKKPGIESAKPPTPDVAVKKPPTPDATATTQKPAGGETIPVIPVDPTPDPTAGRKPAIPDPNAKPVATKAPPKAIVDTTIPIRPARPLTTAPTKGTALVKKADTIVELRSGYTLRGRIKRVKNDQITLGVPGGEYTFALNEVKVLDSSAPEYMSEENMPAASIILKGGQRLRGRLLKANADHVVLVVEKGQIVVDRKEIREVSFTGRIHF